MAISGNLTVIGSVLSTLDVAENRSGNMFDAIRETWAFTDGVAPAQNDLVWSDRQQVLAGGTNILNVNAAGNDVFGVAVVFANITGIIIRNRSVVAGDSFTVGPNAAGNPFLGPWGGNTQTVQVDPSAVFCLWSTTAWAVGAGATDEIRIIEIGGANPVGYDILLVGRSV